jgi:Mn2+/Fe2+ NRAMP family transporter
MIRYNAGARRQQYEQVLRSLGPGQITCASNDDRPGIGTYVVAGASLGHPTLRTALVPCPVMTVVQYTGAKIGMVSGTRLAAVLRGWSRSW